MIGRAEKKSVKIGYAVLRKVMSPCGLRTYRNMPNPTLKITGNYSSASVMSWETVLT